jgi:signal peptidase II
MTTFEGWRRVALVAGGIFALDQVTKQIAVDNLAGQAPADLPLGFEFDFITNDGIAFGLFGGESIVSVITALTIAGLLIWFAFEATRPRLWLIVGLLVGGALGNLADRTRLDAVIDFIDPPRWPAFNVADIAITLGVIVLLATFMAADRQAAAEPE